MKNYIILIINWAPQTATGSNFNYEIIMNLQLLHVASFMV